MRATVASAQATVTAPKARSGHRHLCDGGRPSGNSTTASSNITKAGSPRVRWLLVEAAWRVLRIRGDDTAPLRAWAERIRARRGTRVAVVALARRLAGIRYVLWRHDADYCVARVRTKEVATA